MKFGQPPIALDFPYEAWPLHFVLIVEIALRSGLARVKEIRNPDDLKTSNEEEITNWLIKELSHFISNDSVVGFNSSHFQDPVRGSKLENFDSSKIEKQPDLVFRLQRHPNRITTNSEQDVLICECKIIEENHTSRNFKNYESEGIRRFVCGDYAWAMPHAHMLAYVRWPSDSDGYGSEFQNLQKIVQPTPQNSYISKHSRLFKLPNQKVPGDIELRHIWIKLV